MSRFNSLEFDEDSHGDQSSRQVPKGDVYHVNEAELAFQSADFEKALRCFGKALEFNPANVSAWAGQVKALIELEEFSEAKLWADKALEKIPDHPELLAVKAVALARDGDLKAALVFSDASIQESGGTPFIWLARGDVLLARKEKRADYCFEKACMLAPGNWVVRWCASRIYSFYEKFSVALKYAQEALNLNASSAAIWLQTGQCQFSLGLLVLAENSFVQARQLDPGCAEAKVGLFKISNQGLFSKLGSRLRQLFHKA